MHICDRSNNGNNGDNRFNNRNNNNNNNRPYQKRPLDEKGIEKNIKNIMSAEVGEKENVRHVPYQNHGPDF